MTAMKGKQWTETGEPIKFNLDGHLIDGQNRLKAIMLTGLSQWLEFRFGLPNNAIDYMDGGKSRSLADRMKLHQIKYFAVAAPTIVLIYQLLEVKKSIYSKGATSEILTATGDRNKSTATHATLLDYYNKRNSKLQPIFAKYTKAFKIYTKPQIATLAYILDMYGEKERIKFMDQLVTGANLDSTNPILFLRAYISDNYREKTLNGQRVLNGVDCFNRALICYDLWRQGLKMQNTPTNSKGLTTPEIISMLSKKYTGKLI
jgi:hypothetical protein